jgi:hypothetical protein
MTNNLTLASLMLTDEESDKYIKHGTEFYGDSGPVPYTDVDREGLLRAAIIKAVNVLNQARLINPIPGMSTETDSVKWQKQTDQIRALLKEVSSGD